MVKRLRTVGNAGTRTVGMKESLVLTILTICMTKVVILMLRTGAITTSAVISAGTSSTVT
jgi:hypothetical protein